MHERIAVRANLYVGAALTLACWFPNNVGLETPQSSLRVSLWRSARRIWVAGFSRPNASDR
jgi:hypothetical protein